MSLEYNKNMIPRAKELRKQMTPQEKRLWYDFLSKYPIRFQRQKTIGSYIVDFYCYKAKLVVELDGTQHYTADGLGYDEERTKYLKSFDLNIIRFPNKEIDQCFETVCDRIDSEVKKLLPPPVGGTLL